MVITSVAVIKQLIKVAKVAITKIMKTKTPIERSFGFFSDRFYGNRKSPLNFGFLPELVFS